MKTYYTITLTEYCPRHNAHTEFQRAIIHERDNLTNRGLMRILKRDGEIIGDCQIARVDRACYQSR
jgi:RimJ/RimL family protein N-acetyltransferase